MAIPRSEWVNQAQWAVTAPLLAAELAGHAGGLALAFGLCGASAVAYLARLRSWKAFRVQVRLGFMAVAGLAWVPGLEPVLWVPLVGTSAQVLVGYCPMARLLELMPWNRDTDLSLGRACAVVLRAPGNEGLLARCIAPQRSAACRG